MYTLTYEEFQINPKAALKKLFTWAGLPSSLNEGRSKSSFVKTTTEDLRDTVENFDELAQELESNYPCLLDQLLAKEPKVFPPCLI